MALAEFELIRRFFNTEALAFARDGVVLGPGDDCALIDVPAGSQLALSMDTLNEAVHFPAGADPHELAQRCLRVNLSDLAAMGAEPLGFTLALSLPETDETWLQAFSEGLAECAGEYRCSLLGGDTTRGPLAVTIQVHGLVPAGKALRRNGARAGDVIYVTGTLGDAALALPYVTGRESFLLSALAPAEAAWLQSAFYRPQARIDAGLALRGLATAAIDISDGLASDLRHILKASGDMGAIINTEDLPLSALFRRLLPATEQLPLALGGGDDYELCVTLAPENETEARAVMHAQGLVFTRIGEVVADTGGLLLRDADGDLSPLTLQGYRHFGIE